MRKNRIKCMGGTYRVDSFTLNHQQCFVAEPMKMVIQEIFEKAIQRYNCHILASTITPTSIHLVISTEVEDELADISVIMQYIKSQITIEFNRMHGRRGTIWGERFHSVLLLTRSHIRNAIQLTHVRIPFEEGHPEKYGYSTLGFYQGKNHTLFAYRFVWKEFLRMKLDQGIVCYRDDLQRTKQKRHRR
jgi:putative transposase